MNSQWQAQPVTANCMTSRALGEISKRSPNRLSSNRSAAGSQIGDGNPDRIPTSTKAINKPTPATLGVSRKWELREFGRSFSPKLQPKRLTMKAPRAPRKRLSKPMTISPSTFRLFRPVPGYFPAQALRQTYARLEIERMCKCTAVIHIIGHPFLRHGTQGLQTIHRHCQ